MALVELHITLHRQ